LKTFLLDVDQWDLVLDASGNIAVASDPYSQSQDAASAARVFAGEVWYDTTQGIPYWSEVLGQLPPISLIKALISNAALSVPGVVTAVTFITSFVARRVTGQIQITNSNGDSQAVNF
jgi:hypothetical protein